jgi:hypothetical protein
MYVCTVCYTTWYMYTCVRDVPSVQSKGIKGNKCDF